MTKQFACGQVAPAALQVWAHGSRAAEAMGDTSAQERSSLETALKDTLLPHLSKMGMHASQVRHPVHWQCPCCASFHRKQLCQYWHLFVSNAVTKSPCSPSQSGVSSTVLVWHRAVNIHVLRSILSKPRKAGMSETIYIGCVVAVDMTGQMYCS